MPEKNPYLTTLLINLGCKAGDQVAIVTDDGQFTKPTDDVPDRASLARCFQGAATDAGIGVDIFEYPNLGGSGIEPPESIFAAIYPDGFVAFARENKLLDPLLDKTIDAHGLEKLRDHLQTLSPKFQAMLVISRFSVSHTRFRKLLTEATTMRAATMPGVEPFMFEGVMTANWQDVESRSNAVAALLTSAASATVISGDGQKLHLSLEGRAGLSDTGLLIHPGDFGNLPGGEAFIAPTEGSAEGALAIGPREEPNKYVFLFAKGRMTEILGNPPFSKHLLEAIAKHNDVRNVAELGVGTNEKADAPDNTLEAEKILGTIHLALGDNASFGGNVSVPFHQDYVVYKPTLILTETDGTQHEILREGQFLL